MEPTICGDEGTISLSNLDFPAHNIDAYNNSVPSG